MDIDFDYDAAQDRIRLRLRLPPDRRPDRWWLTRHLALRLLQGWVQRMQDVPMPIPAAPAPWAPVPAALPLAAQHVLLMEYDAPRQQPQRSPSAAPEPQADPALVQTAQLTVWPAACRLELASASAQVKLHFSRGDAHRLLEALAQLSRRAGWHIGTELPAWLGAPDPPARPA